MHFSQAYNLEIEGHSDINFIDVNLLKDTKLYIDPYRIEHTNDTFALKANEIIKDYFSCVFKCCLNEEIPTLKTLLNFAHEPNETKLGLSSGKPRGRGASELLLFEIFKQIIDRDLLNAGIVTQESDICVFVKNFNQDRMSDLITNIIRRELSKFTYDECIKHGISENDFITEPKEFWNHKTHAWDIFECKYPKTDVSVLLVPKNIVSNRYIYSTEHFIQQQILLTRQEDHLKDMSHLVQHKYSKAKGNYVDKPTKKSIYQEEIQGKNRKDYVTDYSFNNIRDLETYKNRMNTYASGLSPLSDEQLDYIVYKKRKKTLA